MDADLNHHPEEIQQLLDAAKNTDVVVGCRSRKKGLVNELPFFKRLISGGTNWILRKAFSVPLTDVTSGYRLYSRKAIEAVRDELRGKNFEVTPEILIRINKKALAITEVPITFTRRPRGTSKLSFVRSGFGYLLLLIRLRF
jgi:dolichol-phosphate mannosyltransferase